MQRSTTNPRSRAGGFTIIELMFTITLAGVILAIGIPSFQTIIASNRLTSQTNEMVSAIQFARSEAITRNTAVTFCRANFEASTNCAGGAGQWNFFIVRTATGTVLRRGPLPNYNGSVSVNSDLTADIAVFSPDGLGRTGGALINNRTFTVCSTGVSDRNIRTVTIGAGSRLSTEKSTGTC
jgi:type IV fimbrial biogenesis protein FimT